MSKTIFITGGSTGIGAASVKKFISQDFSGLERRFYGY